MKIIRLLIIIAASYHSIQLHAEEKNHSLSIELFPALNTVTYNHSVLNNFSVGFSPLALNTLGDGVKAFSDPSIFLSLGYYTHGFDQNSLYLKGTILAPRNLEDGINMIPEFGGRYFFNESTFVNFGYALLFDEPIPFKKRTPYFLPLPTFSLGTLF